MAMTEKQLRQIIKEEARRVLFEDESASNELDGAGVGLDVVENYFMKSNFGSKTVSQVAGVMEGLLEVASGGDFSGRERIYKGWNRDDFKNYIRLILNEIRLNDSSVKAIDNKFDPE